MYTVQELADTLGVTEDPELYSTSLPIKAEESKITSFENFTPRSRPLMASFAASCLPSFLRRLYQTPFPNSSPTLHDLLGFFLTLINAPAFAKYTREHLEEVQSFWLVSLDRISRFPVRWFEDGPQPGEPTRSAFVRQVLLFNRLTEVFIVHSPLASTLPESPAEARKRLAKITPFLAGMRDRIPLANMVDPFHAGLDLLVSSLATENVILDATSTRLRVLKESEHPWVDCDALELGESMAGTCKKLKEGEEMMACGRCQAVRYCSPEHQKLRWKTHKLECFASQW